MTLAVSTAAPSERERDRHSEKQKLKEFQL
jgi:hypothetical protein